MIGKFSAAMERVTKNGTEVGVAADAIFEAATDGSDRLRYLVGEDAKAFAAQLASTDEENYFANITGSSGSKERMSAVVIANTKAATVRGGLA